MSQHKDAARSAMQRLYQRIDGPSAADAAALRIGLAALDRLEPDTPPLDLATATAKQVQAAVEGGSLARADALAAEQAREKPRANLIKWLEADA